ncbi:hypothetical protein Ade02nite_80340 [Paractinoplanes deccanensis]|uniref:Carboxymuconolactone decarboxylase-like domain-containing protein n=1 Tax=Paractinoplanes deccanensis TaxID=113561 RepID=A0ABQ3YHC0_9ACTN|nr:carboxymuconolactone decarboxylase family protein [Actinoplanes deccanensis]GID79393.1 hypothetical protein Ade02nite_80340 [Actinoplanes deccanensis]
MTRLPDPDPSTQPADVREMLASLPPDPMVRALSHATGTVNLFIQMARAQFTSLALSSRSRELVTLAVAVRTECAFVLAQHQPMALAAGVDERTQDLVRAGRFDDPLLTAYDRTLLRFTDTVVAAPTVGDALFAEIRAILTPREIVEVLQVIGYYWTFGRVNTVLQVPLTTVYG